MLQHLDLCVNTLYIQFNSLILSQLNTSQRLDLDLRDDFLIGDDRHVGKLAFDELAHKAAHVDGGQEDRGLPAGWRGGDHLPHGVQDELHGVGIEGKIGAGRGLFDRAADHVFDLGIEEIDGEDRLSLGVFVADVALEGRADVFGEEDGVFFCLGPFAECFEDGAEIFDRDLLLDEAAENLGEFLQRDQTGDLFDEIGKRFFEEFEDAAHLLDADELGGVLAVKVGEVEDHHVERLPILDARFFHDLLVLLHRPRSEGWPRVLFEVVKGML